MKLYKTKEEALADPPPVADGKKPKRLCEFHLLDQTFFGYVSKNNYSSLMYAAVVRMGGWVHVTDSMRHYGTKETKIARLRAQLAALEAEP